MRTHIRTVQAESTYATCYILTVEFKEGGSYNLFSLCDYISVRVILFFTHVTRKHTQGPEAQWGNHNINSARLGLDRHTCTHTQTLTHVFPVYLLNSLYKEEDRREGKETMR